MLHVGVYAVLCRAFDCVCRNRAGKEAVFRIILEVPSRKSSSVDVHRRSVPAGYIHFIRHLADGIAECVCQIRIPCRRDNNAYREADRADLREVVVDRSGAVAVIRAYFADRVNAVRLIAAKRNDRVHFIQRKLIHELIPLRIVFLKTAHVFELEAVLCAGCDCRSIRIFILRCNFCRQVIADVVEGLLLVFGHLEVCRSCRCFLIVREAVFSRKVSKVAFRVIELVGCGYFIGGTLVVSVVRYRCLDLVGLRINNVVRIPVDRKDIITCFEDICLRVLIIIRSKIFHIDADRQLLGCAGIEQVCFVECHEVRGSLFNAAVLVRRIVINFYDVLAGNIACVRNCYIEGKNAVLLGDIAHLLIEGRVGKTIAERILHNIVILDEAFLRCCLVELVSYIDAFRIVDEARNCQCIFACRKRLAGDIELIHVGVVEVAEVVPPGCLCKIINIGVDRSRGRVYFAGNDFAKGCHADMSHACCPEHGLDLRMIFYEAKFESIGAVINEDNLVKVLADKIDHLFFTVVQLKVRIALVPVIAVIECIVVGCCPVGCAVTVRAVHNRCHVIRKIRAFAAGSGDNDHRGVGKALRVLHKIIGILGNVRFRQGPVLCPHAYDRTVCFIIRVELGQLFVGFNACVFQTLQNADRSVRIVQRAGACAAEDRIDRSPAEYVQLAAGRKRKLLVIILQKSDTLLADLYRQILRGLGSILRNSSSAGHERKHRAHRTCADHIDRGYDRDKSRGPGNAARQLLLRLLHLDHGDADNDRQSKDDTDGNQMRTHGRQYFYDVIPVNC